ncbi:hypothetical protein [Microcoleus sp. D2_18a_D3]|uniref:hypothetical protein n=1 Tax=Microcoleus sp. D2_18a_D3 TaxID=3055330 RepID=UPI002FD13848
MEVALPDFYQKFSQSFQKTKGFWTEQVGKAVNSTSEAIAQAKSSLSETAYQAKEALTPTTNSAVNTVDQATNNALGTVADKTEKAIISISEVANQAVSRVSETTNKAVDAVSHSATTAKETINQTTNSAVNTVNQSTSQTVERVNQVTEKAKASLEDSINKAGIMSDATSNALQSAIDGILKNWMGSHPVVFWLVSHPWISLVMLVLFILIIRSLLQALGNFFAKGLLFILQIPLKFMQGVLSLGSKSVSNLGGVVVNSLVSKNPKDKNNSALQLTGVESNSLESQERIANILIRLEAIREEQNQLLQEASAILGNQIKAE